MIKSLSLSAYAALRPLQEPDWHTKVPAAIKRRDPRIWQMAHMAVLRLLEKGFSAPASIITATAFGALDETRSFLEGVYTRDFGSPRNFIASVHNSMGGKVALDFGIRGENLTVCDGPNSLASALSLSCALPASAFPVLVLAIDESFELLKNLIPHMPAPCGTWLNSHWEESAVAFLLTSSETNPTKTPQISACAPFPVASLHCEAKLASMCKMHWKLQPSSSSISVNPSLDLIDAISGVSNQTHICSYSPAGNAAAIISVCA